MTTPNIQPAPADLPPDWVPPLEPGDRLTREEFERRYEAMPHLKKAELIEGVVYMPSPLRFRRHGRPNRHLSTWLGTYEAATPGVEGADNATARLDLENEPQPDALLLIDPARGGQARISADDHIEAAPELVAEVAASSASYDLHTKLDVYRRNGVREYIVWRVLDRQIDWFALRGDRYERLAPGPDGLLRSEVFPGLWLDPEALLRGDLARVLAVVQQGTASPEHAAFVAGLNPPPANP
jgi:Uma2 family endonuclease